MNDWPFARFHWAAVTGAVVAALTTALGTVVLLSPWAMQWSPPVQALSGPAGAALRLGVAGLVGAALGALTAGLMSRRSLQEMNLLVGLLQDGLPVADDRDESTVRSAVPLEMAEEVAEAARRGREAIGQLARLELALTRLTRSLDSAADGELLLPATGSEASAAEAALGRAVQALLDSVNRNRERTGALLAEVEDHLVPVSESLTELEMILTLDGAPAAVFLERRRLVSRARKAVGQVEREMSAVRLRMGGVPVERLTEADFVEPGRDDNGQET